MHAHFGIYGYIEKNGKVLVIEKARGPYKGMYDLPGGSPEEGENNEETLKREFKEELGVEPTRYKKVCDDCITFHYHYKDNGKSDTLRHSALLYQVSDYKGKVKNDGDGEDCVRPVWVSISDLSEKNSTPFLRYLATVGCSKKHSGLSFRDKLDLWKKNTCQIQEKEQIGNTITTPKRGF